MSDRWIYRRPSPAPVMRLFCFPYAGGNASVYRGWQADFPEEIEVCAVELPGRRQRFREPAIRRVKTLVEAIGNGLAPHLDLPFAFFGHSMGALVAFELTRHLRRAGGAGPRVVFLSGAGGPHLPRIRGPRWNMPDAELLEEIKAYGGTPEAVLDEPAIMELFLPIIRADFELFDTYVHEPGAPLDCPVHLYCGDRDEYVTPAQLSAWRDLLSRVVSVRWFRGGHFYLHDERRALTASVTGGLRRVLASS